MKTGLILLAAVLASASLLAACGGDDDGAAESPVLTVNNIADNNERDTELTLREALAVVNGDLSFDTLSDDEQAQVTGTPGRDSAATIKFALAGEQTIALEEALPTLHGPSKTIDGGGTVVIDGSAAEFSCLEIASSESAVVGLRFENCHTGIRLMDGSVHARIGGATPAERNVFLNGVVGIEAGGSQHVIQGNVIGVDPESGEEAGNDYEGIWLPPSARDVTVGGGAQGEGNVISGGDLFGISVDGAQNTTIQGNLIGLTVDGQAAVANEFGISLQNGAYNTLIGGDQDAQANFISGNNTGLLIRDPNTTGNRIVGNVFGSSPDREVAIANVVDVYHEEGSGENTFEDNVITSELPAGSPTPAP